MTVLLPPELHKAAYLYTAIVGDLGDLGKRITTMPVGMASDESSVGLPDVDARMLAEVLLHDPRIVLPAHLCRRTTSDGTVEAVEVNAETKLKYILQLLRHDAGLKTTGT